jgi:hypothetical protein
MPFDPSALSWKDGLIVGWILAHVLGERARRFQGVRIGKLEQIVAKVLGVDPDDDDAETGKRDRKK